MPARLANQDPGLTTLYIVGAGVVGFIVLYVVIGYWRLPGEVVRIRKAAERALSILERMESQSRKGKSAPIDPPCPSPTSAASDRR